MLRRSVTIVSGMKKILASISLVFVIVTLWVGLFHYQTVKDQYIARTTALTPEVQAVHNQLSLSSYGSLLFKASRPEILTAEPFNAACQQVHKELTIVLGCYNAQRFYVFSVDDTRLEGITEVTAAHELLHAAFERLPKSEQERLQPLLERTAEAIDDARFKETIATYKNAAPEHLYNELHSILGTEIAVLPIELESHYARYFKNRQTIVDYAAAYEATFTQIEDKIKVYDATLERYAAEKKQLEQSLSSQQQVLESQRAEMEQLQDLNNIAAYNAQVPEFNARIQRYNNDIAALRLIISAYNNTVEERNQLALSQRELLQRMDSNYTPLE